MAKRKLPFWPNEIVKACIEKDAFLYNGVRKIIQDLTMEVKSIPPMTYEELGYSQNKHKQLLRNYYNPEEVERVKAILEKREKQAFTSVSMNMRHGKKDSRSMGWCMNSLIITRKKDFETVEIQYRATEVLRKFSGDLVFLPFVFEQLGLNPDLIRFRFANAYLSGVFFPTLMKFWDPIAFMNYLLENDPALFKGGLRFLARSSVTEHQTFPYSPEQKEHEFAWKNLPMDEVREYIFDKYREMGKPMPVAHHPIEEKTC